MRKILTNPELVDCRPAIKILQSNDFQDCISTASLLDDRYVDMPVNINQNGQIDSFGFDSMPVDKYYRVTLRFDSENTWKITSYTCDKSLPQPLINFLKQLIKQYTP